MLGAVKKGTTSEPAFVLTPPKDGAGEDDLTTLSRERALSVLAELSIRPAGAGAGDEEQAPTSAAKAFMDKVSSPCD